jgi:hypothetical protein
MTLLLREAVERYLDDVFAQSPEPTVAAATEVRDR